MFDLSGKTALVTGASGAIGGAIARGLHGQGAAVVVTGTRAGALDQLAGELGERARALVCNIAEADAVAGLLAGAEAAAGQIDIVVNNAGITRDNLAVRIKDKDWDDVLNVNLTAAFKISRAALRGMMKRRWGRIVNISSVVGVAGNPGQANYAASKAGMIGMTKALAREVATRGVTVNCVAPGFIETPMTDALGEDQRERLREGIPMARLGTGADVTACVLFLVSEEAAYVTGQTLHVNGGMAMV